MRPTALAGRLAVTLACILGLGAAGAGGCSGSNTSDTGAADEEFEAETAGQGLVVATCVNIRRGVLGVVSDTYIYNGSPNTAFGAASSLLTGSVAQSLIKFDFSGPGIIPAGSTISKATLRLRVYAGNAANINVHTINNPWSESTTWNQFYAAPSPQYGPSLPPPIPVTPNGGKTWDATVQAQAWWANPSSNNGFLLEVLSSSSIYSSEGVTAPVLTLCYYKDVDGDGYTEDVDCDDHDASVHPGATEVCDTIDNNCDGLIDEGLIGTVQNCGSCGNVCNLANATPTCTNGTCQISSCTLGFGDCNANPADGCETPLTTNTDCGGCGTICDLTNATASCATGTCLLTSCNAGAYNCDGNANNGCEVTPCVDGSNCGQASDCQSGVCLNGFCASPSCSDNVQNGNETALDCGGSCPPCGDGLGCGGNADCQSLVCQNNICQPPTCSDVTQNGTETGIDCGSNCPPCADGGGCQSSVDCQSGVCIAGVCQAPTCSDGVLNGMETSPDCGGPTCPDCADGLGCVVNSDCASGVCLAGVCQMPNCTDGVHNGTETDVDCGGSCTPCSTAQGCITNSDCIDGVCVNGFCQAPTCTDGVQNGDETGVDCGGSCFVPETCNGVDDDCNGTVDDGLGTVTCGVGACQVTVAFCSGGQIQQCNAGTPQPEQCDGLLDDDCDGIVDNGCDCVNGETQRCYSGSAATLDVGICHDGEQVCILGQWGACVGEQLPTAEVCDGLDNDCNGDTDEGLGSTICGVGACQAMVQNCVGGQVQSCTPGSPTAEVCDSIDNDCNGMIDDGLGTISCGVGACSNTVPACVGGVTNTCTPGVPSAEQCDGVDNDCDGSVDNGDPGGGANCSTGNQGVCSAGTTSCTGGSVVCNQNVQPSAETCDGLDNDCDGAIDNGNPGGGVACNTGNQGICAAGTTVCTGGNLQCSQNLQPTAEVCDGLDNNCDGVADDGNPGGGLACNTGNLGLCSTGTTSCTGGSVVCNQNVQPAAEECDSSMFDENCDGQVNEGCNCINGTAISCYSAAPSTNGVGVCHSGTQTCVNGNYGACAGEVLPSAETCNGLDDNCDGSVDNGLGTLSCGVGACANTVPACLNGSANVCTPGSPSAEVCNGVDDNCNGSVDEGNPGGNVSCNTGAQGVCSAGTTACTAGALVCNQNVAASAEVCDGLDNNCNGSTDEGDPGGNVACTTGLQGVCSAGVKHCQSGVLNCVQSTASSAEVCDGLDNNCDGSVDNGDPGGGAACSTGLLGVCAAGVNHCVSGSVQCVQSTASSAEICDGKDNDCNGVVDNGDPGPHNACSTGLAGVCSAGVQHCVSGSTQCVQSTAASAEACNGLDDDCNGVVDNGDPGPHNNCVTGLPGVCSAGVQHCVSGTTQCVQSTAASSEICDGKDNNCDGSVDNGALPGVGSGCTVAGKSGACANGSQICSGGALVCNQTVFPTAEVCPNNGVDNNCDGAVDNNPTNSDSFAGGCGGPNFNVGPGGSVSITGNMDTNNDRFFTVTFTSPPASNSGNYFHPKIQLTSNASNTAAMRVDCNAVYLNAPQSSGCTTQNQDVAVVEAVYPQNQVVNGQGCQSSGSCSDNVGKQTVWQVHIRRTSGSTGCSTWTVVASNQ